MDRMREREQMKTHIITELATSTQNKRKKRNKGITTQRTGKTGHGKPYGEKGEREGQQITQKMKT